MRNIASLALTTSALFLIVVAVLLNSSALFYMATAMIATLGACRFQAWLAVRGLKFTRRPAPVVRLGEPTMIEIQVDSEHEVKRPLVIVEDGLPSRVRPQDLTPSLPVAPDGAKPATTHYRFRPTKRGIFRWSTLKVLGTDSLGLIRLERTYRTTPMELTVLPMPIPVKVRPPRSAGWGAGETDQGRSRGAGIDPWGIREYQAGDSLRHVHWRSSARTGQLLVKEFEVGMFAQAYFFLQQTKGSDVGDGEETSLDRICGHVAFIAEGFLRQGISVNFPGLESNEVRGGAMMRGQQVLRTLAGVSADSDVPMGLQILSRADGLSSGSSVYLFATAADETLPAAISALRDKGCQTFALLYDPSVFPTKKPVPFTPSTNAEFMSRLRAAGAEVSILAAGGPK